ncbi:MAG: UDP-N-acetylmuramate--L-alanine ligase [Gemmatimonadales bacterium]
MNLFLASDQRPVHFVGIGGAGMAALALVALRRGVAVSGSDTDTSGCGDLRAAGATVREGIHPEMVDQARAVVASAAIPAGHAELQRAAELGVPVVPRKGALAELIAGARTVAIAGTHGKTTTTVMTAEALEAAGFNPTALAGGRVGSWGGNARIGGTECFVVEADEYDQAFLALYPTVAVINNVEPDHLECYGSVEAMEAAFVEFAGRAESILIGNDGVGSDRVAAMLGPRVSRFGPGAAGVGLALRVANPGGAEGEVSWPDGRTVTLRLQVPGLHNLRNATGALAAVAALGGDVVRAAEALAAFTGVGRRFERLGEHAGVEWVDDYAHHPTEVAATLAAAREAYPGRRLVAVFQPHLYSRTALHGVALGHALVAADLAVVTGIYPAREAPIPGVTGAVVAQAALAAGGAVEYLEERDQLANAVRPLLRAGDVVLTLGAGDITRLATELGVR